MKKTIFALVAMLAVVSSSAEAQIQLGLGLAAPLTGRNIATNAELLTGGVVHVTQTLDASPQILVEFHRVFKVKEKMSIGPSIGFLPRIDFGTVSSLEKATPVSAGFGMIVSTSAGPKHRINFGVMWAISAPITKVGDEWKDGFQAPRNTQDVPIPPRMEYGSLSRLMFTMSVSGLF